MSLKYGRFILLSCLYGLGMVACHTPDTQQAPTLIPTAVLPSPTATPVPPTPTAVPATATATSAAVEDTPAFEEAACASFPTLRASGDENLTCGFVRAPEDRHRDPEDVVRLAVVRIAGNGPASDPVPLVFLPGGPGSPVLNHITDYYEPFIAALQPDRDIIFFDPRGVGFSEPELDCWEVKRTYLQDLAQKLPDPERADTYWEALLTCRNRLQENGANLAAYHSAAIAADVKDILQVMGYDRAHLFGVSYGTRLAQQLMRDYPDLVETAVLDSVVPMDNQFIPETADWQEDGLQALFQACAAQPDCQTSFPDLETVYRDLQTTLAADPIPITISDPIQGNPIDMRADDATLDTALQWALPNGHLSPLIPQMLYDLRDGNGALLSSALTLPLLTYGDTSLGMTISVLCHDQVFTLSPEQLATGAASYPHLGLFNAVASYDEGRFLFELCAQWGAATPEPGTDGPVRSGTPALILAGQLDTTTPPAFGRHIAETLSHSYLVELRNQGHVPTFGPAADCIQDVIRAFLNDPDREPANSCHSGRSQTTFFVPYDGIEKIALAPFAAADLPFTVMAPAQWEAGEHNHFRWARYPGDAAQLVVQASSITIEEWLDFLGDNYAGVGLQASPEYAGELRLNGRVWRLYTTSFNGHHITLSFTREAGITYYVSVASTEQEHAALYDQLLLPVLTSLTTE